MRRAFAHLLLLPIFACWGAIAFTVWNISFAEEMNPELVPNVPVFLLMCWIPYQLVRVRRRILFLLPPMKPPKPKRKQLAEPRSTPAPAVAETAKPRRLAPPPLSAGLTVEPVSKTSSLPVSLRQFVEQGEEAIVNGKPKAKEAAIVPALEPDRVEISRPKPPPMPKGETSI